METKLPSQADARTEKSWSAADPGDTASSPTSLGGGDQENQATEPSVNQPGNKETSEAEAHRSTSEGPASQINQEVTRPAPRWTPILGEFSSEDALNNAFFSVGSQIESDYDKDKFDHEDKVEPAKKEAWSLIQKVAAKDPKSFRRSLIAYTKPIPSQPEPSYFTSRDTGLVARLDIKPARDGLWHQWLFLESSIFPDVNTRVSLGYTSRKEPTVEHDLTSKIERSYEAHQEIKESSIPRLVSNAMRTAIPILYSSNKPAKTTEWLKSHKSLTEEEREEKFKAGISISTTEGTMDVPSRLHRVKFEGHASGQTDDITVGAYKPDGSKFSLWG